MSKVLAHRRQTSRRSLAGLCATWICSGPAVAQLASAPSVTDLSKESENPVAALATLPLRYKIDLDYGKDGNTKSIVELDQAILPFQLNEDWALITRTKLPYVDQPPKKAGQRWNDGLSNSYTTLFLSPERGEQIFWGIGPVIYLPTVTNSAVGVNRWGSGPSFAVVWKSEGAWTAAIVFNNIWSFGKPATGSKKTDSLLVNPIVSYHLRDGWSLDSSPNITADWTAASHKRWTIPLGGGAGKTFRVGRQAMKLSMAAYYDATRPEGTGPVWQVMTTLTFLFPR
jgi:hypothetical protein